MTNYIFKVKYYYGFHDRELTMVALNYEEVEAYIYESEYNPNNALDIIQIYDIECLGVWEA